MTDFNQIQITENNPQLLAEFISAMGSSVDLSFLKDYQDAELANILESVNSQY